MDDQLKKYETYARGIKRMLLFAGLWPHRLTSDTFQFIVIIHVLTSITISSAIVNFILSNATNVSLVTKGLGIIASFCTIMLKIIVFVINRDNFVTLHEILHTTFRENLANDELRPILLSSLNLFHRSALCLTISTWGVPIVYILTPVISIALQLAHSVNPIKYRLPFPSQYPWTVIGNSVLYPTQYFIEILAGCALAGVSSATDSLFGFYIFQIASQFRILAYRMANVKANDDYYVVMKNCAIRHQILSLCCDKLERLYGPIVLWMLLANALNMCANIFQASQISFDKVALLMVYIIMKLMQTLLYGWCGSFLTTESEAFVQSVYCSGWPGSGNRSFMSNVLIMLTYKPLSLTACHFSVISLDMFIAVMNTALSYFFLLRTLAEED